MSAASSSSDSSKVDLDARIDLVKLLEGLDIGEFAAIGLLSRGSVTIDGHTVSIAHRHRWVARQLYGRILKAGEREMRIIGSRLMSDYEQMKLADGD